MILVITILIFMLLIPFMVHIIGILAFITTFLILLILRMSFLQGLVRANLMPVILEFLGLLPRHPHWTPFLREGRAKTQKISELLLR